MKALHLLASFSVGVAAACSDSAVLLHSKSTLDGGSEEGDAAADVQSSTDAGSGDAGDAGDGASSTCPEIPIRPLQSIAEVNATVTSPVYWETCNGTTFCPAEAPIVKFEAGLATVECGTVTAQRFTTSVSYPLVVVCECSSVPAYSLIRIKIAGVFSSYRIDAVGGGVAGTERAFVLTSLETSAKTVFVPAGER